MNSDAEDDPAWDHPLDYLEGESRCDQAIFLHPVAGPCVGEDLSNGQKFELDVLERMVRHGFQNWVFSRPEESISTLRDWLETAGDERSVAATQQLIQEYMLLARGHPIPSLRAYLKLPRIAEPVEVSQCLRYWQEVWGEHGGGYVDSVVFTAAGDDGAGDEELDPREVDAGAPLIGKF
jgi:hypothetical protein